MNLYDYFLSQNGRSMIKNMHYFPIYERHFARFVGAPVLMFEIGTGQGGSAQMWKRFFGPLARIVTIDIEDRADVEEEQIYPRRGDQADPNFIMNLVQEFGEPDIVLDDGSHIMKDVCATFDVLYPRTSGKGVYLVEDINASYYPDYGGGLGRPDTFIAKMKTLIDEINFRHTAGALAPSEAATQTFSVTFYDMVVVLERAPYANRTIVQRP